MLKGAKSLFYNNYSATLFGAFSALIFAPYYYFVYIFISFTALLLIAEHSKGYRQIFITSWFFGLGHFTAGMYWTAIAVSVYSSDFWWFIPLALFGLPAILTNFIAITMVSYKYLSKKLPEASNPLILATIWIFFEWIRSWIFTGLPWNLMGYSLFFSLEIMQLASIFGVYGLSFLVIFIAYNPYLLIQSIQTKKWKLYFSHLITVILIMTGGYCYGKEKLKQYPTKFHDINIRLVQPSIAQENKWDYQRFMDHLNQHIKLSQENNARKIDFIIWSEAAVTVPYQYLELRDYLSKSLPNARNILITGGVIEDQNINRHHYSGLYGLNNEGEILFKYKKSHLVPFGEYIPLSQYVSYDTILSGLPSFSAGEPKQSISINIKDHKLNIRPLLCYEAIFPNEVKLSRDHSIDAFVNVTNDSWFADSSGPYQHFDISRLRAIENGVPLIRVGNNGISAIIDSLGRIINQTQLNEVIILDGQLPKRMDKTIYTIYNNFIIIALLISIIATIYGLIIVIVSCLISFPRQNKICKFKDKF